MSCSVSEAVFFLFFLFYFYKQLVAEQITLLGEPARYTSRQGCRHCEGWIITSPEMFFWLKVWIGRLAPQREDLKDPTSLTLLARLEDYCWGRQDVRKGSFSRFEPFSLFGGANKRQACAPTVLRVSHLFKLLHRSFVVLPGQQEQVKEKQRQS